MGTRDIIEALKKDKPDHDKGYGVHHRKVPSPMLQKDSHVSFRLGKKLKTQAEGYGINLSQVSRTAIENEITKHNNVIQKSSDANSRKKYLHFLRKNFRSLVAINEIDKKRFHEDQDYFIVTVSNIQKMYEVKIPTFDGRNITFPISGYDLMNYINYVKPLVEQEKNMYRKEEN